LLRALLSDPVVAQYLDINEYEGTHWYRQEAMNPLLGSLFVISAMQLQSQTRHPKAKIAKKLRKRYRVLHRISRAHRCSENKIAVLFDVLNGSPSHPPS